MRFLIVLTALICLTAIGSPQRGNAMGTSEMPRPEYPRPNFQRENWINLNGTWDFAFDPDEQGLDQNWFEPTSAVLTESIVVPFPWQSSLSGIEDTSYTGVAWYRRTFTIPDSWDGQQVILNFGAVDYRASVWVNGQAVGEHEGGYTPFEFDMTENLIEGENMVSVRVEDPADLREIPHGKQSSNPPNPWDDVDFTTTSGIWQTVWLEARPQTYIAQAHFTPDIQNEQVTLAITINSRESEDLDLQIDILGPDGQNYSQTEALKFDSPTQTFDVMINLPAPLLWSPETPNLYYVELSLNTEGTQSDVVQTYFGMRSIEISGPNVLLNGNPIYLRSALVQGYWPEGLYTAPTDEALRADIAYAKEIGFNGLRMHLKIEDPRWAYWADQLGMLLWNDMPCPVAFTPLASARVMDELEAMIARDYNHPSIVIWGPYNESWGLEFRSTPDIQAYLLEIDEQIRTWDPTRLVVDNSGWRHVKTDIADSHKYSENASEWRNYLTQFETSPMDVVVLGHPFYAAGHEYNGEPLMVSEYGAGWGNERPIGFQWQTIELRRHGGIVGYTYTELYDIEHELAGLANYDRSPKPVTFDIARLNSADFVGLDYRGSILLRPGDEIEVPVFISAYGQPALSTATVDWRLERIGDEPEVLLEGSYGTLELTPYGVTELEPLMITLPEGRGSVRLWVEIRDPDGTLRGQNSLDLGVF